MSKIIREAYMASLGLAVLTYEKAERITNELIKKGELAKEKQQKFIQELMEKSKKNSAELEKVVKAKVKYLAEKGGPLKDKQDKLIEDITFRAKVTGRIAEQKIRETVKDTIRIGKQTAQNQQKTFSKLKDKIIKSDEERMEELLKKLDIPSKQEIDLIRKKLDELESKLK
jgi:polyhydroxyalkanoate synthesis regulator phasin